MPLFECNWTKFLFVYDGRTFSLFHAEPILHLSSMATRLSLFGCDRDNIVYFPVIGTHFI